MADVEVTRGSSVKILSTPKDVDGEDIVPTGDTAVRIYFRYQTKSGYKSSGPFDMEQVTPPDGAQYRYIWDTSALAIEEGTVYYHVRSSEPSAGEDGEFPLSSGPANPDYVAP